jgi:hypothetical protein
MTFVTTNLTWNFSIRNTEPRHDSSEFNINPPNNLYL